MNIDNTIDDLVSKHGIESVLGAIVRRSGDPSPTIYNKTGQLRDPTQDRSAEINRQKKIFKISVSEVALVAIDCLARAQGVSRSDFVADLISSFSFESVGTRKRLAGGLKRKQVGFRLTENTIEAIQGKASAVNISPGKWLGCLLEAYTQQLGK